MKQEEEEEGLQEKEQEKEKEIKERKVEEGVEEEGAVNGGEDLLKKTIRDLEDLLKMLS